jgi:hypothetical protein
MNVSLPLPSLATTLSTLWNVTSLRSAR